MQNLKQLKQSYKLYNIFTKYGTFELPKYSCKWFNNNKINIQFLGHLVVKRKFKTSVYNKKKQFYVIKLLYLCKLCMSILCPCFLIIYLNRPSFRKVTFFYRDFLILIDYICIYIYFIQYYHNRYLYCLNNSSHTLQESWENIFQKQKQYIIF